MLETSDPPNGDGLSSHNLNKVDLNERPHFRFHSLQCQSRFISRWTLRRLRCRVAALLRNQMLASEPVHVCTIERSRPISVVCVHPQSKSVDIIGNAYEIVRFLLGRIMQV